MSSVSSIDTVKPPRSPSSASSPTLEDDIAQTRAWLAHDDTIVANSDFDHKGKQRQRYADLGEGNTDLSDTNSYPPKNDQEAETRRVEEVRPLLIHNFTIYELGRCAFCRHSGSGK